MDDVFPKLSEIPVELRARFQQMIAWLEQANLKGKLTRYNTDHIFQILDGDGILQCLFKRYDDDDELSARKEASVYLLDHPSDGHRSVSSSIYGFSGVLPTVFVRFTNENESMMGVLVEFVETVHNIYEYSGGHPNGIGVDAMHKISVLDVRFGNMDRNEDNLLVRVEENDIAHLVPIDHEMSFSNEVQNYNICGAFWLAWLKENGANVGFSEECVDYVTQLDPTADLDFLRRCGWDPDSSYAERLTVFAIFLKKAVLLGITAYHIGVIAAFKSEEPKHTLQDMVDSVERDGNFFVNVEKLIEERLREYSEGLK